ncbi:DUF1253-domain-containing protein [Pisolithus orientalis]|uniref:DUF1253-domain-containing protein n=1 Tax=Pisolithus orientalis TaxID=936130 RepID=UPI0022256A0C|nr:DUF1253-domain-containing protein [Pisolithus orientalis]KAI6032985.1 DUF1253-domain-containing protein [Pisolithus orientalis]
MAAEDTNSATTKLLTLLNVSALKSRKRVRAIDDSHTQTKESKRKRFISFTEDDALETTPTTLQEDANPASDAVNADDGSDDTKRGDPEDATSLHERHFGANPEALTERSRLQVNQSNWKTTREKVGALTVVASLLPEFTPLTKTLAKKTAILERLRKPFLDRQAKQQQERIHVQNDLLSILSAHFDLYHPAIPLNHHQCIREAITLHALDHVTKKRRRILKNNERIFNAKNGSEPPEDIQDQGFTRPSVLVLLPFRSFAVQWINALTSHTPPPSFQIENHSRFLSEYELPPDVVDKLATVEKGTYPDDHVEMFKGNMDDNFRIGVKLTRKSIKLFAEFYGCDIIFASPLGLRMSIEKEKSADFLSSIEILVMDQMNAMAMQNWDHIEHVLSHMNKFPNESHDADFSRIKPWYLDGYSAYLRQSILLSPFETPEMRALYHRKLKNIAGKIRVEKVWPVLEVPGSLDPIFTSFDCLNPQDEASKRFDYFTTQLLPKILKSAVQSSNTIVFIPSSFDFIRVHNYFRKQTGLDFTTLSEYSSNQDISRARQAFFTGKKSFLLVSERFHFYRRYKIRGIRNIIFYALPEHPQFFSEFLSYPFLDDGVDSTDVSCHVMYCKYDWFRLERILGTAGAKSLMQGYS